MADLATWKTRLDAAEEAYHKLLTGDGVVEVHDQNGERVVYQRANISELSKYIRWLRDKIAQMEGKARTAGPGAPMRVWM